MPHTRSGRSAASRKPSGSGRRATKSKAKRATSSGRRRASRQSSLGAPWSEVLPTTEGSQPASRPRSRSQSGRSASRAKGSGPRKPARKAGKRRAKATSSRGRRRTSSAASRASRTSERPTGRRQVSAARDGMASLNYDARYDSDLDLSGAGRSASSDSDSDSDDDLAPVRPASRDMASQHTSERPASRDMTSQHTSERMPRGSALAESVRDIVSKPGICDGMLVTLTETMEGIRNVDDVATALTRAGVSAERVRELYEMDMSRGLASGIMEACRLYSPDFIGRDRAKVPAVTSDVVRATVESWKSAEELQSQLKDAPANVVEAAGDAFLSQKRFDEYRRAHESSASRAEGEVDRIRAMMYQKILESNEDDLLGVKDMIRAAWKATQNDRKDEASRRQQSAKDVAAALATRASTGRLNPRIMEEFNMRVERALEDAFFRSSRRATAGMGTTIMQVRNLMENMRRADSIRNNAINDAELLKDALDTSAERAFIVNSVETFEKIFNRAYTGGQGSVPDFDIFLYDANGNPKYIVYREGEASPFLRQVRMMRDNFINHFSNENKCRVALNVNGLGTPKGWEAAMKFITVSQTGLTLEEQKHQAALRATLEPCLENAIWTMTATAQRELDRFIDAEGYINFEGYTGTAYERLFADSNAKMPAFVSLTGSDKTNAEDAFKAYIANVRDGERSKMTPEQAQNYIKYSSMGTGYLNGSSPKQTQVTANIMAALFGDDNQAQEEAVKKMIDAFPGHGARIQLTPMASLSPTARQVLRIRREIINRIIVLLEGGACRVLSQNTSENAKYKALKRAQMAAGVGIRGDNPESSLSSQQSELLRVLTASINSQMTLEAESNEHKVYRLIRIMGEILNHSINCERLSGMTEKKRRDAWRSLQRKGEGGMTLDALEGSCQLTARSFDMLLYDRRNAKTMASVIAEIKPYAPLHLVDEILIRMGLPCRGEVKSLQRESLSKNQENCCPYGRRALIHAQLHAEPRFEEAYGRFRKSLSSSLSIKSDDGDDGWDALVGRCIEANERLAQFNIAFRMTPVLTPVDIETALQEERVIVNRKSILGEQQQDITLSVVADNAADVAATASIVNEYDKWISSGAGFDGTLTFGRAERLGRVLEDGKSIPVFLPRRLVDNFNVLFAQSSIRPSYGNDSLPSTVAMQAALQTLNFNSLFDKNMFPLEQAVLSKMVAVLQAQARSLCALPKDECMAAPHCSVIDGNRCASQRMHRADNNGNVSMRPMLRLSKTTVMEKAGPVYASDIWKLGMTDVYQDLNPENEKFKTLVNRFDTVRNLEQIYAFIATLSRREPAVFTNKGEKNLGMALFTDLGDRLVRRNKVLRNMRIHYRCNDLVLAIQIISAIVDILVQKRQTLDGISDKELRSALLVYMDESELNTRGVGTPNDALAWVVKTLSKSIPDSQVEQTLCLILSGIYALQRDIEELRCDLSDAEGCAAAGPHCKWSRNQCYNSVLTQMQSALVGGFDMGVEKKILRPEFISVMVRPDRYKAHERAGILTVMEILLGSQLVRNFPAMDPGTRTKAMIEALEKKVKKIKEPTITTQLLTAEHAAQKDAEFRRMEQQRDEILRHQAMDVDHMRRPTRPPPSPSAFPSGRQEDLIDLNEYKVDGNLYNELVMPST